jgi:chromosomal replication initiation ATPase DnaA
MLKLEQVSLASRAPVRRITAAGEQVLLVQMAVAEVTGVGLAEIGSDKRGGPNTAFARQMAMYLCHLVFEMSARRVGDAFGRDRATVRHALNRIEELRENRELDRTLNWLEAMLRRAGRNA